MVNHSTYEVGLWIPYDGSRFKDYYDIKLKDGTIHEKCYPNSNFFCPYESGVSIHDSKVEMIRLLPDEELDIEFEHTGEERHQRNLEDFDQKRFYGFDDYTIDVVIKDDNSKVNCFIIDVIQDNFSVVETRGFALYNEFLLKVGHNGMQLLAYKAMELKNEYLNRIRMLSEEKAIRHSISFRGEQK